MREIVLTIGRDGGRQEPELRTPGLLLLCPQGSQPLNSGHIFALLILPTIRFDLIGSREK